MKKTIYSGIGVFLLAIGMGAVHADALSLVTPLSPVISNITPILATASIDQSAFESLYGTDTSRVYFEYSETQQVCIMIYPTPENCKPKKTNAGELSAALTNLKPATSYTVTFKRDNTIACVTTPCPGNGFQSEPVTFTTLPANTNSSNFTRNLSVGSRGADVILLQDFLREKGYLASVSTGYYGGMTRAAVRMYQTNDMRITATGTVGPLTRASLGALAYGTEERFSGKITAVSTACFADGECSVSVDGKKVVTTIGWSRDTVGFIKGKVTDIGSLESMIGTTVNVFAKKTASGYTLYGSTNYYIEVL